MNEARGACHDYLAGFALAARVIGCAEPVAGRARYLAQGGISLHTNPASAAYDPVAFSFTAGLADGYLCAFGFDEKERG